MTVMKTHTAICGTLMAAVACGGCTLNFGRTPPARRHYLLQLERAPEGDAAPCPARRASQRTLIFPEIQAPLYLDSLDIHYRPAEFELEAYKLARWVERPATQIWTILKEYLERTQIFKTIAPSPVPGPGRRLLRVDLRRFHHDARTQPGAVIVELRVELSDPSSAAPVERRDFSSVVSLEEYNAEAAVKAFHRAVGEIAAELAGWLAEER